MEHAHSLDVLAFSPHPDDAELYCAGTLLLLARAGRRVGIVDLTRGETPSSSHSLTTSASIGSTVGS